MAHESDESKLHLSNNEGASTIKLDPNAQAKPSDILIEPSNEGKFGVKKKYDSADTSGILRINGDCIIKQPYITIHGRKAYHSLSRPSYVVTLNLTGIVTYQNLTAAPHYQLHYEPHLNELDVLKLKMQEIFTLCQGTCECTTPTITC